MKQFYLRQRLLSLLVMTFCLLGGGNSVWGEEVVLGYADINSESITVTHSEGSSKFTYDNKDFTITNSSNKTLTSSNFTPSGGSKTYGIKFPKNVTYTINLPTGMYISSITFGGWSNSDTSIANIAKINDDAITTGSESTEGSNYFDAKKSYRTFKYDFATLQSGSFTFTTGDQEIILNLTLKEAITITFNANGGSGTMEPQVIRGTSTLKTNEFTRYAYGFVGWNTATDGTGTDYTQGQSITPTDNMNLYAQWLRFSPGGNQQKKMAIGGNINYYFLFDSTKALDISANDFSVSSEDETIATVTKGGWNNTNKRQQITVSGHKAGKVRVNVTFGGKDGTLYGQTTSYETFIVNATITYNTNGGNEIPAENNALPYDLPTPTKDGYTFVGWYADEGLTQPVDNHYTPTTNATLYAKWELKKHVVYLSPGANGTINAVYTDGGAKLNSGDVVNYGTSITLTAVGNYGYKFNNTIDNPWGTATTSKENPLTIVINDDKDFSATFEHTTPPTITSETIADATYERGTTATQMSVTATATNGGNLSYRWYSNTANTTAGGKAIDNANKTTFTPPTDKVGTTYYYCLVTEGFTSGSGLAYSKIAKIVVKATCNHTHTGVTIGEIDQTTPYRGARSEAVAINKGETKKFRFTNHGNTDYNWNNWNLVIATADSKPTGIEPETEELVLRSDKWGWGPMYNTPTFDGYIGDNWSTFRTEMQNAEVEVTVVYNNDGTMTITAVSTGNSHTYTETENTKAASDGQKYVYFIVDQSHMTNYRELLTIKASASDGGTISVKEGETVVLTENNSTAFVEPNSKITVTASCSDNTKYFKNWSVTGTQGVVSTDGNNYIYTIDAITANTVVKAKFEAKSNETVPAPENTTRDTDGETLLNSFTAIPFNSSQAEKPQTIALNLPPYATAETGEGATIEGDILTITAPAQNTNKTVKITVTAHDGTTKVDYDIKFSTDAKPAYTYTVNAVDGSSNILKQLATGEASEAIVAYPQHILKESTLYTINKNATGDWFRKTVSPTEADYVENITYNGTTVSDVVFYTEGEDIAGWSKANNAQRASQGQMGYGNKTEVATLAPGTYEIHTRGVNGNAATRNAIFTVGDKEVYNFAIGNGTNILGTSKSFTIWEEKKLYVSCDGSSQSGLDWFYVQKPEVLNVTENEQKFPFTTEVIENSICATKNTSGTHSSTKDGVKGTFCGVKNAEHYVTVTEIGALGFYIKAYHNNSNDTRTVDIYDGETKLGSLSVAPGTLAESIKFALSEGQHTIKVKGAGADVYLADIIFLTEQPEGALTTSYGEMKVTEKSGHVFTLASTSGGAISMTSAASNDFATLAFNTSTNELTVTPIKYGTFDIDFNIAANGAYAAGTSKYTVNIRRENLEMTLSDNYEWNKTTQQEHPAFNQPTVTVKDENKTVVPGLTFTYATDDQSVATVNGTTITPTYNQGSANITISFAGNDSYAPVEKQWAVSVIDGYVYRVGSEIRTPTLNEKRELKGKNDEVLVNFTFGGWKYSMEEDKKTTPGKYVVNGSTRTDDWEDPKTQNDLAPIDGYEYGISGKQDAVEETKNKSVEKIYGSNRYGWFQVGKPFSLPVRGSFMTFEPTKNGTLTIYILQNGAWNTETKTIDGKSKNVIIPGQFRPHAFYIVNQSGTPVQTFAPESFSVVTKQKVTNEYKCIMDHNDEDYHNANNIALWPEFNTYLSSEEQAKVFAAWNSGTNGAQQIVELDNHAFLAIQKGIVKYTFHAVAGQTYYLFSNFSKLGFSGMNFVEDKTEGSQPKVDLVINDPTILPTTSYNVAVNSAPVNKVTESQYRTITYNRTFAKDKWTSLCLPFYMSPAEVEANFGEGTQIITFDGAETPQNSNVTTFHFVYHEIQGILPGYPYLIKPTKETLSITVNNKIAYPAGRTAGQAGAIREFSTSRYWNGSEDVYRAEDSNQPYTFVGSYNGMKINDGSVYCNNTGVMNTLKRKNSAAAMDYPPFRAIIRLNPEVLTQQEALSRAVNISMGGIIDYTDDTATLIDEILFDEEGMTNDEERMTKDKLLMNRGVYNLSGQKVNANSIQKGIYIVNGKKYVK